jgi:hypothetical protein
MNDAELEKLWEKQYPDMTVRQHKSALKDQKAIQAGNYVRISMKKNLFEKGFTRRYSREIFKVAKVSYSPYRVFYHLKDLENEPIKGIFYRNELQKYYDKPENINRVIEKVVKRTKGKVTVKFIGWPQKFNQTMTTGEYNKLMQQKRKWQKGDN